jgi:uncharacterized protein YkwD
MDSRPRGRRVAVGLSLAVACLAFARPAGAGGLPSTELRLVGLINQVRAAHFVPPLRLNATLERAARAHSRDMLEHDYFGHGALAARLWSFGVRTRVVGENLAWIPGGPAQSRAIVRMWLASPMHRRNLLRPGFRRIGLAMPVGPFAGYRSAVVATADFSA